MQHAALGAEEEIQDWQGKLRGKQLLGRRVKQIRCGATHFAAITEHNEVVLWGLNYDTRTRSSEVTGQCGIPFDSATPPILISIEEPVVDVACGTNHTAILTSESLYVCGSNQAGQLGNINATPSALSPVAIAGYKIHQVACGGAFTLALSQCGVVFSWGDNSSGQVLSSPAHLSLATSTLTASLTMCALL
jgi:alpha-tubulin suppressor-like RCC1 family protein